MGESVDLVVKFMQEDVEKVRQGVSSSFFGGKWSQILVKLGIGSMALQSILNINTLVLSILRDLSASFDGMIKILFMGISMPIRMIADLLGVFLMPFAIALLKYGMSYWKMSMQYLPAILKWGSDFGRTLMGSIRILIGILKIYFAAKLAMWSYSKILEIIGNPVLLAAVGTLTGLTYLKNPKAIVNLFSGMIDVFGALIASGLNDALMGGKDVAVGVAGLIDDAFSLIGVQTDVQSQLTDTLANITEVKIPKASSLLYETIGMKSPEKFGIKMYNTSNTMGSTLITKAGIAGSKLVQAGDMIIKHVKNELNVMESRVSSAINRIHDEQGRVLHAPVGGGHVVLATPVGLNVPAPKPIKNTT